MGSSPGPLLALLLLAAAGLPAALVACGGASAAPVAAASPAPASSSSGATALAAHAPFASGAAYTFTPRPEKAKLTETAVNGYFSLASDGRTAVSSNSKSARLILDSTKLGPELAGTHAYRSAFSPSVKMVATTDEDSGHLSLYEVPSGKLQRRLDAFPCNICPAPLRTGLGSFEIAFSDETTLFLHDGTQLRRLDLSNPNSQPVNVGPPTVGMAYPPRTGDRWVIANQKNDYYYTSVTAIDAKTGATRVVVNSQVDGQVIFAHPSPTNNRVCYQQLKPSLLVCASTDDGQKDILATGDVSISMDFSADGQKFAFVADGPPSAGKNAFVTVNVADFDARTVRALTSVQPVAASPVSVTFVSPTRIFVTDQHPTLFDLSAGWSMDGFPQGSDPMAVPGDPTRLDIIAASSAKAFLTLYWTTMPE